MTKLNEPTDILIKDVKRGKVFHTADGKNVKNIKDLHKAIITMKDKDFNRHVNAGKHDFSSWIQDVHGHVTLANKLFVARSLSEVQQVVGEELSTIFKKKQTIRRYR